MTLPPLKTAAGISYRESGSGAPVVLLHGIGSTSAGWRAQYEPLGERFRVIAWTAPGYQDSPALPMQAPHADDYADALAALLDAIGVARASLVTNSWGTLIGLGFAGRYPQRVQALVLGGPSAGAHGLTPEQRAQRTDERIARIRTLGPAAMREQDVARLVSPTASKEALAWAGNASGELPTIEGYAQAARMLYATDGVELISALEQRILVISGTEDIITPPADNAKRLAAAARQASFTAIEACGHLPHLEKPGRFNSLVRDFLEKP